MDKRKAHTLCAAVALLVFAALLAMDVWLVVQVRGLREQLELRSTETDNRIAFFRDHVDNQHSRLLERLEQQGSLFSSQSAALDYVGGTVTLTVTISAFLIVSFFPETLARLFNNNTELVELVGRVMPIFFGGIWAFGAQSACQSSFMALGQAKTSLFLALLRKIILLVPLAILFPRLTGSAMSIYVAEPVADILASATTLTIFLRRRRVLLPADHE